MDEIFVVEQEFYLRMIKKCNERDPGWPPTSFYNFSWNGKKIYSVDQLMGWAIITAEEEIRHSKEFYDKRLKRTIELVNEYKWVKNKKKYSRCGKWIKSIIKGGVK